MTTLRLLAALALGTALTCPALARENHALLVGASTYENLDERYWLVGPANDVDLVQEYLLTNGQVPFKAENITVLADGVAGATDPTLAAIRGAMADLASKLEAGDFVYLHFSGHGSQAPALEPDEELDGLDELFLPVDIGPWSDTVGTVENALVDDEIGEMIGALRAKGATVWAVFDSCHSGTVTRAAPTGTDDVRLRKLEPDALGIPDSAIDLARPRALPSPADPVETPMEETSGAGSFIAFYAAQTNETTPEKRLPRGAPDRRSQGVFTYTLFETLAARPDITYRQLGQEILRRYAVNNLARSTPMFEGDLDEPVFATGASSSVRQWPAQVSAGSVSLDVGRLHGVDEGLVMALVASPADDTSDALGYFEVVEADTFSADLAPVAESAVAAMAVADVPRGAYLRKVSESVDFALTVALPPAGAVADRVAEAMPVMRSEGLISQRIMMVEAGEPADLRLAAKPTRSRSVALQVLPATGLDSADAFELTPTITLDDKSADELAVVLGDTLTRMAKVQNVLKLGSAFTADSLDVDLLLETRSPSDPGLRPLETLPVPRLVPDDEVHVLATNNEGIPIDLNVLYVGSDYSITHMFRGRLQPGDQLKQGLLRITDEAFGRDRVVMVLTPAARGTSIEDLGYLEQESLPPTRKVVRSGSTARGLGVSDLMEEAGFGLTTRAAAPLGGGGSSGPSPAIHQFDIDTRPGS